MKTIRRSTGQKSRSRKTDDALEIIDKNLIGSDAQMRKLVDQATLNAQVAQSIYDARQAAELTQKELAQLVGTTQSVISQLENSDYDGHSLSMLRRIGEALQLRVEVRLVPNQGKSRNGRRRSSTRTRSAAR